MMITIIGISIVILGFFYIFHTAFRHRVDTILFNSLAWVIGHTPTRRTAILWVVGWIIGIVALAIGLVIGWIWLWSAIGEWTYAPLAGLIIGVGLLVRPFGFRRVLRPLIGIAAIAIVFGLCLPILKQAINRNSDTNQASLGNYFEGFSTRMAAGSEKYTIDSRRTAQVQQTWVVKKGVVAFNCSSGKKEYSFPNETEVVSLGESRKVEGIPYEKCALPDLETGPTGNWMGWIRSVDLVEKPEPPTPGASAEGGAEKKILVTTLNFREHPNWFQQAMLEKTGKYILSTAAQISYDGGLNWTLEKIGSFDVKSPNQKACFLTKGQAIELQIFYLE